MSFTSLTLPMTMDSSSSDLVAEFFTPVLAESSRYDRGVGFFSSGWLRVAAEGLLKFAGNGGRARWVTSPVLDEADWEAIKAGDAARDDSRIRTVMRSAIVDLQTTLDEATRDALAWMVADETLTFKLALPRNKLEHGNFHDKFGIFEDLDGNRISFNGSYNDSIQGTRNYEAIKVFCSWTSAFAPLVEADAARFNILWENLDPNVRVFDIPEAAREQILQLRTGERPYPKPIWVRECEILDSSGQGPVTPRIPVKLTLRDYQLDAIDAWLNNDCRGLFEMATGTGKTITALACAVRLFEQDGRLAVIIAAPYQHLVDQWDDEARAFGFRPVLAYQSKARWLDDLNHQIVEYNAGYRRFHLGHHHSHDFHQR